MDEVKILQSGSYYMTPFYEHHMLRYILSYIQKQKERYQTLVILLFLKLFAICKKILKSTFVETNMEIMMASGVFFLRRPTTTLRIIYKTL